MAGCYGSHPIDQWYEAMLNDYLREDEEEEREYEPYLEMPDCEIKADTQEEEIEIPF